MSGSYAELHIDTGYRRVKSTALGLLLVLTGTLQGVQAATIDTNPYWTGSDTGGWYGSGQSITVDPLENFLADLTFYFSPDSNGRTFDFFIRDQLNGGNVLFQTAATISTGANVIDIGSFFVPGAMIFAQFDYRGFGVPSLGGQTTHYIQSSSDPYTGGYGTFGAVGNQQAISDVDLRFIAHFTSGPVSPVPLPGTLGLMAAGFASLALVRRRTRA
jgi:hypothetical protein